MVSGKKKALAYFIYIAGLILVFLVLLFPDEAVQTFIEKSVKRFDPGIELELGDVGPSLFPPSLKMRSVSVYYQGRLIAETEYARLTPAVFALLGGTPEFSFKTDMFGGIIRGKCRMETDAEKGEKAGTMNVSLSDIKLDRIHHLKDVLEYPLSGTVNGELSGTFQYPDFTWNYAFTANVALTDAAVVFSPPLLGMDKLAFETIDAAFNANDKKVVVERCAAKGVQVDAKITGDILWRRPYPSSVLKLDGFIKPHSAFVSKLGKALPIDLFASKNPGEKGFSVGVNGTLDAPEFSMR